MPKAEIEVPEGMTAEKLLQLVTSYEEKRVTNSVRNKARREATQKLVNAHKPEFEGYVKAAMPKA